MFAAITRAVSRSIASCELTHLDRAVIDFERASYQHRFYEEALSALGVNIISLPEAPELPDSVFVEDTAVVFDECAVITRPGAESRRLETESIACALSPYRKLFEIKAPGTLDGGDVLPVGKTVYVGLTRRSNQPAVDQLQTFLHPYGYTVKGITVTGCLHLKSAVTQAGKNFLLINPSWVKKSNFSGMEFIEVDPQEPYAANILVVGNSAVYQPSFPKTLRRLEAAGVNPVLVDMSELAKAEGALTCCSLIFKV